MRLILASASPRRRDLLAQIGVTPDHILAPEIDETPRRAELPRPYCLRIARAKAEAVEAPDTDLVLAADTTVAMGRRIMGKPEDAAQAAEFLVALAGRRHTVITAVALRAHGRILTRAVVSAVRMRRLSDDELNAYLASGEWRGKAGGYGIQGRAGAFVPWLSGSFTGVVGLPLAETAQLLTGAGYPLWRTA